MLKFDLINASYFEQDAANFDSFESSLTEFFKNVFHNESMYDHTTFSNKTD